jgi:hypothetical protein
MMNVLPILHQIPWKPVAWIGLVAAGGSGLLIIVAPKRFSQLASWCNLWIDTDRLAKRLDYRVEIDAYVLRYGRLFGLVVVAASLALAYLALRFAPLASWISWAIVGVAGSMGTLALLSPRRFARLAEWSSIWVDTDRWASKLDRRVEIDSYVLRYGRRFGAVLLAAAALLAALMLRLP